ASNQTCPTRHVQPKNDMSEITRRAFVRKSTAASAVAANAALLNGLINASASAGEGPGSTGTGTTQPGTTHCPRPEQEIGRTIKAEKTYQASSKQAMEDPVTGVQAFVTNNFMNQNGFYQKQ